MKIVFSFAHFFNFRISALPQPIQQPSTSSISSNIAQADKTDNTFSASSPVVPTPIPKNTILENNIQNQLHKNNYNPFISSTTSGLPSVSSSLVYNSNSNLNKPDIAETTTITTNILTKTSTGIYQQFQQQIQQQKETNSNYVAAPPLTATVEPLENRLNNEPIYKNHMAIRPPAKLPPHGQDIVNEQLINEMNRLYQNRSPYLPRKNLEINSNSNAASPQPLPKLGEFSI